MRGNIEDLCKAVVMQAVSDIRRYSKKKKRIGELEPQEEQILQDAIDFLTTDRIMAFSKADGNAIYERLLEEISEK